MNSLVFANQSSATNCWLTTPRRLQHPPSGPASPQVDSFSGLLRLLGELVTFVVGLLGELITSHSPHQVIDIPELSGPIMITKICHTEKNLDGFEEEKASVASEWNGWAQYHRYMWGGKAYSLGKSSKKRCGGLGLAPLTLAISQCESENFVPFFHWNLVLRLCYIATQPFCGRATASSKEEGWFL